MIIEMSSKTRFTYFVESPTKVLLNSKRCKSSRALFVVGPGASYMKDKT